MIAACLGVALLVNSYAAQQQQQQQKKNRTTFSASFLGENGSGAPATTGAAGQFIEEAPRLTQPTADAQAAGPRQPQVEAAPRQMLAEASGAAAMTQVQGTATETTTAPASGRIGAFVMVDPATARRREQERITDAVAQPRPPAAGASRGYALWGSMGKPLKVTSARVEQTSAEEAAPAAGSEFEARVLGADKSYHPQAAAPQPRPPFQAIVPPAAGQLFVAVDLNLPPQTELKDAVASFSRLTGFVADPRFAAASGTADASRASLRGWLPTDRLAQAIQAPGVVRIEVDHGGPRPLGADAARTSIVVGLRIPPDGNAADAFKRVIAELSGSADFKWTRTIGFQTLPDSRDVALVIVGEAPVTRIPRLLAHPDVLKIAPAPSAAEQPRPAKTEEAWPGFLTYARRRAPLLLTFTALFLLPQVGEWTMRLLRSFVPYSRR